MRLKRTEKKSNIKIQKKEPLKKAQNNKIANVAGSVLLSLFMDGSVKCKLPSTPPISSFVHVHTKGTRQKYAKC